MATSIVRDNSLADPRHLMRFLKAQAIPGTEEERFSAIAKQERVSVTTIKESVRRIELYRGRNSHPEMEFAIRDLVISAVPRAKETLDGLLTATELVEMPSAKTGRKRIVKQEDKATRLEAMRIVGSLITSATPKAPLIENNVSQTTQVANLSAAETMEERLDRLRTKIKAANQLPAEVAAVPRHLDRDEDADDEDDESDDDKESDEDEE